MTTQDENSDAIAENEKRIAVHEVICAERYKGILDSFRRGEKRMQRIEYIIYFLLLTVVMGRDGALRAIEVFFK